MGWGAYCLTEVGYPLLRDSVKHSRALGITGVLPLSSGLHKVRRQGGTRSLSLLQEVEPIYLHHISSICTQSPECSSIFAHSSLPGQRVGSPQGNIRVGPNPGDLSIRQHFLISMQQQICCLRTLPINLAQLTCT